MALLPSSSSFSSSFIYEVFLSFRGTDTRYGFTGYLYKALRDRGIDTFIDDEELQKGDEITPALLEAIGGSRIAIIVLSKNYASSSFCLDELSNILDCINEKGRLVLPVFYDVEPCDVRRLNGSFGEAMAKHEERFKDDMEKLKKWKMALQKVASLSGWHLKPGDGYEHKFIAKIVEQVSKEIKPITLVVDNYLVGLETKKQHVISLLDVGSDDKVHMVGLHGIGGIGKTTLALTIYNLIAHQFERSCFLEKVRENSEKHELLHLQKKLLFELAGEDTIQLTCVRHGISIMQQRLQRKKILLILDDVDKQEQLVALAGRQCFGPGSRVIITTRDKHLLTCHEVESTYEVEELKKKDAFELLKWNAFKTDKVCSSYVDILNRAVTYASGLPLALEVIGSHLFKKSLEEWESALDGYKRIPNKDIQNILKVSFDALGEEEQSVFLDISCCFKGYQLEEVEEILCAHHGGRIKHHIGVLVEKSLIKIEKYWFGRIVTMHDLIEDMGKEIVRQEYPKHPGKRSRLWSPTDIVEVLEENTGTAKIEMMCLNFSLTEEVDWNGEAFKNMKKLKTLIIKYGHFSKGPEYLPNSLKVLEWWSYPSHVLPSDFHPKKLTICKLPESCLTSLELPSSFKNVTILSLDECKNLTTISDVSGLLNLEEFSFIGCKNLITIHNSVGLLDKLKVLDAQYCSKLKNFPPLKLTSLESLRLSGCEGLVSFPEILVEMTKITKLHLEWVNIEFPFSFYKLSQLRSLWLHEFRTSFQLPSSIYMMSELVEISLNGDIDVWGVRPLIKEDEGEEKVSSMLSSNLQRLEFCSLSNHVVDEYLAIGLQYFAKIKELDLSESEFTIIPECIKECHFLWKLVLNYCRKLEEIRGIPPNLKYLNAKGCESLSSSSISMLLNEEVHEAGNTWFYLPSLKERSIPEWFEHHQKMGLSTCFSFRNKFPHIALSLGYYFDFSMSYFSLDVIINNKKFECFDSSTMGWMFHTILFHMVTVDEALLENERSHANNQFPFLIRLDKDYRYPIPLSKEECRNMKGRVLMGGYDHNIDEALSQNDWNHVEIKVNFKRPTFMKIIDEALSQNDWNHVEIKVFMEIGIHVLKEKNNMEDICLPDHNDNIETVHQLSSILFMGTELNADIDIDEVEETELNSDIDIDEVEETELNAYIATKRKEKERLRSMLSSNFEYLDLSGCHPSNPCFPMGLFGFPNLKEVNLSKNDFFCVPKCFEEFHFLWKLQLDYCKGLKYISGIPPSLRYLSAKGCKSLSEKSIDELLKQELHEAGNTYFCLPGAIIPEWFEHRRMGLSTSFWFRNKFPHIALCLAHSCPPKLRCFQVIMIINDREFEYEEDFGFDDELMEKFKFKLRNLNYKVGHTFLFHVLMEKFKFDEALLEHEWNHVEIKIHSDSPIKVEMGIHVFKEKSSMNDICFTEPCTKSDFNLALLPENDAKRKTADLNLAQLQENDANRRKLDLNLPPPPEDDVNTELTLKMHL